MNKLNNKFLWILLCISSNCLGMDNQLALVHPNIRAFYNNDTIFSLSVYNPRIYGTVNAQCNQLNYLMEAKYSCINGQDVWFYEIIDTELPISREYKKIKKWKTKHRADKKKLIAALKELCFDKADSLLKDGVDINSGDKYNNTPLHYAVMNLDPKAIKFLLYRNADPNKINDQGVGAYQMAIQRGGTALQAFEECKKIFSAINIPAADDKPLTVMKLLAHDGRQLKDFLRLDSSGYCSQDIRIAEDLLKQCEDKVWNELSLNFSPCSAELLWLVRLVKERSEYREGFLKQLGANQLWMTKELIKINPYLLYTYKGEYESDSVSRLFADKLTSISSAQSGYCHVKELLHQGFDLNFRDDRGMTLLCRLIMDITDTVKYADVLKVGVSVNTVDIYGKTPLSYAVTLGIKPKVEALLRYDAVVAIGMIADKNLPFRELLCETFDAQRCYVCEDHPENMSNIPCLNRHVGSFICQDCYDLTHPKCPVCERSLGKYGM